jgi:hypothetical protein
MLESKFNIQLINDKLVSNHLRLKFDPFVALASEPAIVDIVLLNEEIP